MLGVKDTCIIKVTYPLVVTLMLGVNGTGINQCNPSTSGDPDTWCEWHMYKSM